MGFRFEYKDEPIYEDFDELGDVQPSQRKRFVSLVLTFALFFVGTTLAGNINIGAFLSQEFGQGILKLNACSGSNSITIKPKVTFGNQNNGGSFKVSSIDFSNVPAGCDGFDFTLLVFDSTTATAKALYLTDSTTVTIGYRSGSFGAPSGQSGYSVSNPSSGAFTVTFANPVLVSSDASQFTLQSGPGISTISIPCNPSGTCNLGSQGPGGGTVIYYAAGGFSCGPSFTSTGSPTGGLCHYLEVAPAGWNGGAIDPLSLGADAAYQTTSVANTSTSVGSGYKNTLQIIAQGNSSTIAAPMARAYNGGGLNDWFLPSSQELLQFKNYATTLPYSTSSPGYGYQITGGVGNYAYYWSSSQSSSYADMFFILSIPWGGGSVYKSQSWYVRPMRAF